MTEEEKKRACDYAWAAYKVAETQNSSAYYAAMERPIAAYVAALLDAQIALNTEAAAAQAWAIHRSITAPIVAAYEAALACAMAAYEARMKEIKEA